MFFLCNPLNYHSKRIAAVIIKTTKPVGLQNIAKERVVGAAVVGDKVVGGAAVVFGAAIVGAAVGGGLMAMNGNDLLRIVL